MIIDQTLLDELTAQAKASPRLRMAYDLRTTPEENSQPKLNAIEPGTILAEAKDGKYEPVSEEDILRK